MKGYQLHTEKTATFDTDLQEAHAVENLLGEQFKSKHNCIVTTSQDKGSFSDWDVSIEFLDYDTTRTFEIKHDKQTYRTGNVAVEWQRTMKDGSVRPTCISISKADVWAYYINSTFYLIDTEDLRQMIREEKYSRIMHNAGDGNRASIYLFSKEVFIKHAQTLKNLLK